MAAVDDILLHGGLIVDGSGLEPFPGALLVKGERILAVEREIRADNAIQVDVGGLVVSPGFIDMHTHSDVSLLSDPDCVSAVGQGITTQVVGHCGFSAAPTDQRTRASMVEEEPVFGFPGPDGGDGNWGWETIPDYLEAVRSAEPRTNVATLVGHNTVRRLVVGSDGDPVSPGQIAGMQRLIAQSLDTGAIGFSTGLSYAPGLFAGADELVALAGVCAGKGYRYHTHMRYGELTARESLKEAIDTARAGGASLNVSHLYPGSRDPEDEAERLLEMVDEANTDGVDVTFDLTLFRRGGGAWSQGLPAWAREGGHDATVRLLADAHRRDRLVDYLRAQERDWDDDLIVKVNRSVNQELIGMTIGDLARSRGVEPAETALSLVQEDGQFWVAPTIKRQGDLDLLLSHPACIPVTDGMAAHPVRHRPLGLMPKTFGTFPLLFGDYVRRREVLSLAEAVARVTSMPAERLGLARRGRLKAGWSADLVVFDPSMIDNRATDVDPGRSPGGIVHVMVNGSWALTDGQLTSARPGRALTS